MDDHGWGYKVPGSPDVHMCAYTHVFNTLATDAKQLTAAEIEGRRQIRAMMDIARKYGGEKNRPSLLNLPANIGIRETRVFQADSKLEKEEVLECKRFPNAIANGTYPIDVHDPQSGKFKIQQVKGDFYQVPLSTMVNSKARNIVMAGRMISSSREAFGAIRVMVNLNQVGEAAGVLAALATAQRSPVAEVQAGAVREQLAKLGAVII